MTKRSAASIKRRMEANTKAHHFDQTTHVELAPAGAEGGLPCGLFNAGLRYSRLCGSLSPELRVEFEAERAKAARCNTHGELTDPAVIIIGKDAEARIAFVCPWCSGDELRERWEREGAS